MRQRVDDGRLMAYLDGELSDAEATAVEQALAASPELREREAELRQLLGDLVFDFAQLDGLDALALTRYAAAQALPPRVESTDADTGTPAPESNMRGRTSDGAGPPEPLSYASAPSLRLEQRQAPPSRPWSRTIGWLAAAGLLVAIGAGGGWWFAGGGRTGSESLLATDTDRSRDASVGQPPPNRNVATTRSERPNGRATGATNGARGAQVAADPGAPGDARDLTMPQSSDVDDVARATVNIALSGAQLVAATDAGGDSIGGVRNFTREGVRIAVAFGTQAPDSIATLDATDLARLIERASAGTSAQPTPGRALGGQRLPSAPRDSLCPAGIRFVDKTTGLPVSIRGPASCALLARLAQELQVRVDR